jgi:hypothetical protein
MQCKSLCGNKDCLPCFNKSFASSEKSLFLHDTSLNALTIYKNTHTKYDFDCEQCGHMFATAVSKVTREGRWCPFCSNQRLCAEPSCLSCLNKSFASHPYHTYWSNKNTVSPREVLQRSNKTYMFHCVVCKHDFETTPNNLVQHTGCPFCAVPSQRVCEDVHCKRCYERSFASADKSVYWSTKNVVGPRTILKHTNIKYWFTCNNCSHEFEASPGNICFGKWCPYCAKYNAKLCDKHDCEHCFKKSFASVGISKYWSSTNRGTPRDFTKYSTTKHSFDCECGHQFQASIHNVSRGKWCPFCCHPTQKLCHEEGCVHCYERSFASHPNATYWSKRNELPPRKYIKFSLSQCWFNCPCCGNDYLTSLGTFQHEVTKCPLCVNKTEYKLYIWMSSQYGDVEMHKSYEWSVWKGRCYFDFVIESRKIIIELDGQQHFNQVSSWESPEDIQKRDIHKMKKANENGYTVVRLLQVDVYKDKNDWQDKLRTAIEAIYKSPSIVYIASGNQYDVFITKVTAYQEKYRCTA